jgi:hypothetical protein
MLCHDNIFVVRINLIFVCCLLSGSCRYERIENYLLKEQLENCIQIV